MERWVMARVMVETGELRRNAVFQTTLGRNLEYRRVTGPDVPGRSW